MPRCLNLKKLPSRFRLPELPHVPPFDDANRLQDPGRALRDGSCFGENTGDGVLQPHAPFGPQPLEIGSAVPELVELKAEFIQLLDKPCAHNPFALTW